MEIKNVTWLQLLNHKIIDSKQQEETKKEAQHSYPHAWHLPSM